MKDEICSFDARKITPEIRASVEELLEKNANSFDPKVSSYPDFWLIFMQKKNNISSQADLLPNYLSIKTTDCLQSTHAMTAPPLLIVIARNSF